MAGYGKRFRQRAKKGLAFAKLFHLSTNKDGYYITDYGPKTVLGLYEMARDFQKLRFSQFES